MYNLCSNRFIHVDIEVNKNVKINLAPDSDEDIEILENFAGEFAAKLEEN